MTESSQGNSLRLELDETRTGVILRTKDEYRSNLVQLIGHFPSGSLLGRLSGRIDLDDLLTKLRQINQWPDLQGVSWEKDLADLVRGNMQDAKKVSTALSRTESDGELGHDEVMGRLGDTWEADLRDFQLRDVSKLLSLNHGANFSVPGAGKTRVALAVYAAQKSAGNVERVLIVCPKSAYDSWTNEVQECFTDADAPRLFDRSFDGLAEFLVVNYERLDPSLGVLATWLKERPSMIILDEAHRMKLGSKGTYGSACMALGPLARRRLILTGTPAPNGTKDLENLLGFVWPGYGQRTVTSAVGGGDLARASTVLRPLFTRTTKQELGLPKVTSVARYVDMPPLHKEIYSSLAGGLASSTAREDLSALGKTALRLLMAATSPALIIEGASKYEPLSYQLEPLDIPQSESLLDLMKDLPNYEMSPKYEEAAAIVAENAALGRKTLVWTTFVKSLTTLEKLLGKYNPAVVHGGTPDRDEQIRRFRVDSDCKVLLSNPATLGEGISLHDVCHDAIYVDRDFMAGRYLQSLDRIHRLGLAPGTETRITVIVARETVDEVVETRLQQKLEFMGTILDDPSVRQLADLQEEPAVACGLDWTDKQALLDHLAA